MYYQIAVLQFDSTSETDAKCLKRLDMIFMADFHAGFYKMIFMTYFVILHTKPLLV